jgi:hypothetical protein
MLLAGEIHDGEKVILDAGKAGLRIAGKVISEAAA